MILTETDCSECGALDSGTDLQTHLDEHNKAWAKRRQAERAGAGPITLDGSSNRVYLRDQSGYEYGYIQEYEGR